jgi:hypothetical protein
VSIVKRVVAKRGVVLAVAVAVLLLVAAIGSSRSNAVGKTVRTALATQPDADPALSNGGPVEPPAAKSVEAMHVASIDAKPQPSAALAEPALMGKLRDLGDSAPLISLALAREGNQRFPDSPNAAERAWWVCKSLVNLADFTEARQEARTMVLRYPGTSFALDIERHLLINPGGPPDSPADGSDPAP